MTSNFWIMNCRLRSQSISSRSRPTSPAWREGCAPSPSPWNVPAKLDPYEKPVTICSLTATFTWLCWRSSTTWKSCSSAGTNSRSAEKSALISETGPALPSYKYSAAYGHKQLSVVENLISLLHRFFQKGFWINPHYSNNDLPPVAENCMHCRERFRWLYHLHFENVF